MQHVRGRVLPSVRLFQLAGKSAYLLLQVDNGWGRGRFFASLGPIRPLRSRCCISPPHKSGRCGSGARLMSAIPQQRREISPEVRIGLDEDISFSQSMTVSVVIETSPGSPIVNTSGVSWLDGVA